MSYCVPNWELDENPTNSKPNIPPQPYFAPDVPSLDLDYEVAELTWENGQITMHGLSPSLTWEKLTKGGTLEAVVNQGTFLPLEGGFDLVPRQDHRNTAPATTPSMSMDALVPNNNCNGDGGMCEVGCSTRVGSCSGKAAREGHSGSGSATYTRKRTLEMCEVEKEAEDEADKKRGKMKYSVSNKRSRAAAIHNQSERVIFVYMLYNSQKRRDKINDRMKTLQKLVPNSNKTDKASLLDEAIEYLKQLQAQVNMMNRMNMSHMMMPLPLQQQQLQMSMMAPMMNMPMPMGMGMGMGNMGMGAMDINSMPRHNIPPIIPPAAFMPLNPWEALALPTPMSDPLSTFLACQPQVQPMNMDAYTRMAAFYQQLHQAPGPSKN